LHYLMMLSPPRPRLYAMDTFFFNSLGAYTWNARCEMLRELGFEGTYLTLWSEDAWADLSEVRHARERFGIEVAGIYWTLDLDDRGGANHLFLQALRDEERVPHGARFEIAIVGAEVFSAADERLSFWLGQILDIAASRELRIALYPHVDFWMETLEQATQIAQQHAHPQLSVVFCGYHWFAAQSELGSKYLQAVLSQAAPLLSSANLCGSTTRMENRRRACSIELIGRGALDNFALLGMLQAVGLPGWIGLQGFGIGGDAFVNLRESIACLREMLERVERHAEWARLRAE
jgi:sugar phosphate isomerase/epimerase